MVHRNASISNETISREQTIAKLRKLARICKWATICITTALALGLLAVIAIDLLLILPGLSQGSCLQSVELQAGEGPCLAIVGTDAQAPLMLVAHDGHTAIGSLLMTCLALTIAISVRRLFFNIEKEGRPFDLECNQTLRRVGHLFLYRRRCREASWCRNHGIDTLRIWRQLYGCVRRPIIRALHALCRPDYLPDCQYLPLRVYPAKTR